MYPSNVGTASAPSDSPSSIDTPSEPYTITFTVSGGISLNIASPMPERFSLAMSANWDAPFARSSASAAAGIVGAATRCGKILALSLFPCLWFYTPLTILLLRFKIRSKSCSCCAPQLKQAGCYLHQAHMQPSIVLQKAEQT